MISTIMIQSEAADWSSDVLFVVRPQNLCLAFGSMIVGVAPTVAGILPLWVAVFVHEGTTLLTAVNSLRLLLTRPSQVHYPQMMDDDESQSSEVRQQQTSLSGTMKM